jgi:hypothetical protein
MAGGSLAERHDAHQRPGRAARGAGPARAAFEPVDCWRLRNAAKGDGGPVVQGPGNAAKLRPPKVPFVLGSASNKVPAAMAWAGRC